MQLFYEDAATVGWQEEVRLRRQTGAEPMSAEEREKAEAGLQARLLSEASVRELAEVMQHVRRLSRSEVERGETLQDVDSWAEGSMGVRPTSEGETSTVDKFMLATSEVAPVGQGQMRTVDQTPPLEFGVREGVVEPRDGILPDSAQDPHVIPFGTLPTAASPSPDVMEEVARGLAQRSAAQDRRRTTEGSARVLSPDEVDRAIQEVTTRLESIQTQASTAPKRAKVGEESARDRCSWCGRGGHHRGDCPAFQHDLDRGIVQFDAQGRLRDMHHTRIQQGRHDMRVAVYSSLGLTLREDE
ncbi:hypothetical protein CBR_g17011 [Chara braunii]|uniref:CCHC-type domain-containing protein n=1 Tax=Chara braunii TaxID=69332 RepID=A0A388KUJ0_CHABU|nr:hypothetical protein CBR_g17011 [Chara braunii]|eukprot:GBG73668.1 hypothetical protein CBR_g17011 [Chara braunii]